PRLGQDVLAVHLVVERMEPPRRIRLRGSIQGSLKFSRFVEAGSSPSGTHQRLPPAIPADQVRRLPSSMVLLPRPQRYCAPLRLPLRSRPLRRIAAYRARRSQATRELAPHGSHCWGEDGSLLFPRWLCQCSTPSTPLGSSGLHLQALHPFRGLRLVTRDSAPSGLLAEPTLSTRQASLHAADRWLAPSQGGLAPALRRPGLPERRLAATKVAWFLL